jgi:hypothetical protein
MRHPAITFMQAFGLKEIITSRMLFSALSSGRQ